MSLLRSFRKSGVPVSGGLHPRLHYAAPTELRAVSANIERGLQAIVDLVHQRIRDAADCAQNERAVQCDEMFALDRRGMEQPARFSIRCCNVNEELCWFRCCPVGCARNEGQDHILKPGVVVVRLNPRGPAGSLTRCDL